jgi:hypothetical protein
MILTEGQAGGGLETLKHSISFPDVGSNGKKKVLPDFVVFKGIIRFIIQELLSQGGKNKNFRFQLTVCRMNN